MLFIVIIVATVLISGCIGQQGQPSATTTTLSEQGLSGVETTGDVREFEITAKNWEFVPNTIEVNLGDKVELHIESVDVTHGFRLSEFGINERLEPHQDVHVEFIADKRGTFYFSCSVPCGAGHGSMSGQLIVR